MVGSSPFRKILAEFHDLLWKASFLKGNSFSKNLLSPIRVRVQQEALLITNYFLPQTGVTRASNSIKAVLFSCVIKFIREVIDDISRRISYNDIPCICQEYIAYLSSN
jgi:hypothetical protein